MTDTTTKAPPAVNATLTRARRREYRETADVADAVARLIRSIGKRVATEDPEDLTHLLALDGALSEAWSTAIAGLRRSGATDREIGEQLGTTRQAVHQRWPRTRDSA